MDREEDIPAGHVSSLLTALYDNPVIVAEAYSAFDQPTVMLADVGSLISYIDRGRSDGETSFDFRVHFLEANGYRKLRRINLIREQCDGATWRETTEGWGLVQLQIRFLDDDLARFRIAAGSEKRAFNWYPTFPELGDPVLWNWKVMQKHTRRLIRLLRKSS